VVSSRVGAVSLLSILSLLIGVSPAASSEVRMAGSPEQGYVHALRSDHLSASVRATTYTTLGTVRQFQGQCARAIGDFRASIQLRPSVQARLGRAQCLLVIRRYQAAIADFTAVINLHPYATTALFGRGVAYFQTGRAQAGVQDLDHALGYLDLNSIEPTRSVTGAKSGGEHPAILIKSDGIIVVRSNNAKVYVMTRCPAFGYTVTRITDEATVTAQACPVTS
jgi:tetratricopeptide (TPR) repeat protein